MRVPTRPSLERIMALDRAIRAGGFPNASTLAAQFEVTARTIHRDIEFLRDRLGVPIAYDPSRNGYHYLDPTYRLALPALTEGEMVALHLAERVLRQYRGTPYAPDLARAFRKITAGLTDLVTFDLDGLDGSYSFRTTASDPIDPTSFDRLACAIRGRRRLALDYYTASRDATSRREVDPYHLASVDTRWYLIAHCHTRGEILIFTASRIRTIEATDLTFTVPEDFQINEYLAGAFGVMRGEAGERHLIRLRFTGEAARYVRERTWHPSQAIESDRDGVLVLRLELSHLREVEKWALSWGVDCEVLAPSTLRERVARSLREAARCYEEISTESPRERIDRDSSGKTLHPRL